MSVLSLLGLTVIVAMMFPLSVAAQSLPAGFRLNPYGIAGSESSKQVLGMPRTSPVYDWVPYEKAALVTVRPYSTHFCFYDKTKKKISRSDAEWQRCKDFISRNKGRIWVISNEPDSHNQDNLTPTEYAYMFNTYHVQVRQLDPTATFAIASVTGVVHHREIEYIRNYYDQVFTAYRNIFGTHLPFDYWNLHAYYHGWLSNHPKTNPEMVNLVFSKIIDPYISYTRQASGGIYANKPILATEIGIAAKDLQLSNEVVIEYMNTFTDRLIPLVDQGVVKQFFWFYGGWYDVLDKGFMLSSLLDSTWKNPTPLGVAYIAKARAWDRKYGLERADFTQDTKINLYDYNRLVKAFGTTNVQLSLDANSKVTTNDLTLFKQVWNFLE